MLSLSPLSPLHTHRYFVRRNLYPNVDFYSGICLRAMGIPLSMFTVVFAVARCIGWSAQVRFICCCGGAGGRGAAFSLARLFLSLTLFLPLSSLSPFISKPPPFFFSGWKWLRLPPAPPRRSPARGRSTRDRRRAPSSRHTSEAEGAPALAA
jgi:hypothetical protein